MKIEEARLRAELAALKLERDELRADKERLVTALDACRDLISAMETCHICSGQLIVDSDPVHCENCSYDCDEHAEPACPGLDVLCSAAKRAIKLSKKNAESAGALRGKPQKVA